MAQLSLFATSQPALPYTVSQLTGYIRRLLEEDAELQDVWVEGEVSNFRRYTSGHCYFTLKDAGAELSCVLWRSIANGLDYLPTDGDAVLAHGRVGVYETRGVYQLYVDALRPAGVGDLYRQFELLKARLEAEGLFAPERKRPLPAFPRRIGVVTSPDGAALRDILHVLGRRYPLVEVLLAPTRVQGTEAPAEIRAALAALNARDDVDLIIVARGGGSLEELWAFNDEGVARAIAGSRIPVISGVGHETDFTIADFAADVRAPTPSAAAEMAVPDRMELQAALEKLQRRLVAAMEKRVERQRWALAEQQRALRHLAPAVRIATARQRLDDLLLRAGDRLLHRLALQRERLSGLVARLESLSPLATLERGYAIVRHAESGRIVHRVDDVAPGDPLQVRVQDGTFDARVT